ncbi:MAG TPA: hypothetical protein VK867_09570 [Candidatus Limnocylindrales bacterium]|nr:hypothetical protein [Candidatus Limnocylindrales bacterium]
MDVSTTHAPADPLAQHRSWGSVLFAPISGVIVISATVESGRASCDR